MGKRGRGNAGKGQRRGGDLRRQAPDSPESLLADLARSLVKEAATLENALEAEQWASYVEGTWRSRSPLEAEATAAFAVRGRGTELELALKSALP